MAIVFTSFLPKNIPKIKHFQGKILRVKFFVSYKTLNGFDFTSLKIKSLTNTCKFCCSHPIMHLT